MVRFEWVHYKRILRKPRGCRWTPVGLQRDAFYSKLYREDEDAEKMWSGVATNTQLGSPVVAEEVSNMVKMEHEYVSAQVRPGQHFSVMLTTWNRMNRVGL